MKYLLDANIISEPTKKQPDPHVSGRLQLDSIFSCTSATVWHELWHGVHLLDNERRKQELSVYLEMLRDDGFGVLPFDLKAAEWLAAERVRLKQLGLTPAKYDSEIAAVAAVNNLILVTRNTDDFVMFDDLRVENWFST